MALVQVKVLRGEVTNAQKMEIISRLTESMVAIEGEALRSTIHVTVEDIEPSHWGIGGRPLTAADLRDLRTRATHRGT